MHDTNKDIFEICFENEIRDILRDDRTNPPPEGGVLFTGSSIFRFWHTLKKDMHPLPVHNRAFGGARTWEVLHYMDRLVLPLNPKLIVYYCGSNDIGSGSEPRDILIRFQQFVDRVKKCLPYTKTYYVSINLAPQKMDKWDRINETNTIIEHYCINAHELGFIDINPAFFTDQANPRMELYIDDGLHFMPDAYRECTRIIKPVLEQAWHEQSMQKNSSQLITE